MLLVPRQLRRAGLTGDAPYYGGRLSPAQAYAASHRASPSPTGAPPGSLGRSPVPEKARPTMTTEETLRALEQLRDDEVITSEEYDDLRSRMST